MMVEGVHGHMKPIYKAIRAYMMSKDAECTRGNLKRSVFVN